MNYNGMTGQDKFLDTYIFKEYTNGTFIDIGAFDGIGQSNTYFFESVRNWSGICVEASPTSFKELIKNRKCKCINNCVYRDNSVIEFTDVIQCGYFSGITENYADDYVNRFFYGDKKCNVGSKLIMNTITLNNIFEKYNYKCIDYCSIDTEGSELDILSTFDFNKYKVGAFTIESIWYKDKDILRDLMEKNGYKFVKFDGMDDYFVNVNILPHYN